MIRRRGKSSAKLLLYLFSRKSQTKNNSNRSLYIALVFATFFALMIILQILSVEKSSPEVNIESNAILGLNLNVKQNFNKEMVFPSKLNKDFLRIVENEENSVDFASTHDSNQSNSFDYNRELMFGDGWQTVSHTRHKFYVFSAYYDNRNLQNDYIRVIGATKTRTEERVYCKLWFAHNSLPSIVFAINKLIRENWNLKYSAYFILCPLMKGSPIPDFVSIIIRETKPTNKVKEELLMPSNRLLVHKNLQIKSKSNNDSNDENIAVCVKPLHYEYNKTLNLIEFIEMNRILGVNHFILYNHSIGPNVDCLLRHYINSGLITMLSWNLNIESQKEIRTEGLFAALNDCLYRTMNDFHYVLMVDIDELIVPYRHPDLKSMLKAMSKVNKHRAGAYSFRNAFFYSQWPDDPLISNYISYSLTTLLKTRRKSQLNLHKQRSKCIVIPENVVEMGNHFVWEFIPSKLMVNIDSKVAALHHYRVCEFGGNDCIKTNFVTERRVHFWKDKLITNIEENINKLSKFCYFVLNKTIIES